MRTSPTGLEPAPPEPARAPWRHRLHTIIFEADTPAGRTFDIVLILAIVTSIILVILETVTQRGWWKTALTYQMFYHVEHHLFPAVPTARLPELAARVDRVMPHLREHQVY